MRREQFKKGNESAAIRLAGAVCVAAMAASGMAHGARPVPSLNAAVCAGLSGQWVSPTCTIPEGTNGVATTDFRITKANALEVRGGLTVNAGVTIANAGAITVANTAGVELTEFDDAGLLAGILLKGNIDNSGSITIQNPTAGTVGIATSVTVSAFNPDPPDPYVIVPGVLANSGTIAIQNSGDSQGINNLGTLDNAASGTITIANTSTGSVGIRNRRDVTLGSYYYLIGKLTNAGSITTGEGGDGESRGISNSGAFTNMATGTFAIGASTVTDVLAFGLRNNGSFTNFGTFINNRGIYDSVSYANSTWGSYNLGVMINHGKTYTGTASQPSGSFQNDAVMLNLGEITSYGTFYDNSGFMYNLGTFYNYGYISGGGNIGVCIDEPGSLGGC